VTLLVPDDLPAGCSPQERGWWVAEATVVAGMGAANLAIAAVVEGVVELLATNGWVSPGIASPEHWVQWKTNTARHRAAGIVQIARRVEELPVCWQHFREGRITEDAMVLLARKAPAERDAELCRWAMEMTIPQLGRILRHLPKPAGEADGAASREDRERRCEVHRLGDGWLQAKLVLPPDEAASFEAALTSARDAELRDRRDLPPDEEVEPAEARTISMADAFARMCSEALDGMDKHFCRTGHRGERHQVVIHRELDDDGCPRPAQLHQGDHLPEAVARYMSCDADVLVAYARQGRIVGITPEARHPNRWLRRYLEHRDGGCAHPLCQQRRFVHAHHLLYWEDGGLTVAENLVCLCPRHHRSLHLGDFTIEGDPQLGNLVFRDRWGRAIAPPATGAAPLPTTDPTYRPPRGERLHGWDFGWA
jgi:hypothetical protein